MSKLSTPIVIVIGVVVVAIVIVAGLVANSALNDDDEDDAPVVAQTTSAGGAVTTTVEADDEPLTKSELEDVQAAALRIVGDGTVTDADRSDDPGEAYEVEVVTDQGEIDVALDENLKRVPNQAYDD